MTAIIESDLHMQTAGWIFNHLDASGCRLVHGKVFVRCIPSMLAALSLSYSAIAGLNGGDRRVIQLRCYEELRNRTKGTGNALEIDPMVNRSNSFEMSSMQRQIRNRAHGCRLTVVIVTLLMATTPVHAADYFPPPDSQGGWRTPEMRPKFASWPEWMPLN